MTPEEMLAELAVEVGATVDRTASASVGYNRDKKAFALLAGNVLELRLDPDIAEAALGTPRTSASPRGTGWVRLELGGDDPHDLDRARAWFLSAWRNAAG